MNQVTKIMDIFSRCKYYFAKCGVFTILQNVVYLLFCKMWSIYYCAKGGVLHVLKGNIFNLFAFNPIPQSCKSEACSADVLFCSLEATLPHF